MHHDEILLHCCWRGKVMMQPMHSWEESAPERQSWVTVDDACPVGEFQDYSLYSTLQRLVSSLSSSSWLLLLLMVLWLAQQFPSGFCFSFCDSFVRLGNPVDDDFGDGAPCWTKKHWRRMHWYPNSRKSPRYPPDLGFVVDR